MHNYSEIDIARIYSISTCECYNKLLVILIILHGYFWLELLILHLLNLLPTMCIIVLRFMLRCVSPELSEDI